jgi:hypothetical protein
MDVILILVLLTGTVNLVSCGSTRSRSLNTGPKLIPLSNRDIIALNAEDIVQIMRRAGFSDEQILQLGTEMRNNLAQYGAVQIKTPDNNKIEATFAVHDHCVYISTRLRGSFIYSVKTGWLTPLSHTGGHKKMRASNFELALS